MDTEIGENEPVEELSTSTSTKPNRRPKQRKKLTFNRFNVIGGVIGFVIITLVISLIGGVTGFVALTSDSSFARTIRRELNINANNPLPISTTSKVTLEESSDVIDAAAKILPAVVSISASQTVSDYFSGQTTTQEVSAGTGFIISSDGLIVTNKHVVSETGVSYKVVLNDGRIFDATVQATDPLNDLAIVKIDAKDLPTVELGSSSSLQVGQYVLAVGNALGQFNNSVSLGIISAKNRTITADDSGTSDSEDLTGLLQTDASINPGNSGGPLVNLDGQVVGIDTAIASDGSGSDSGSIGVGFAIPIDSVSSVIASARETGQIIRPYLGVRYVPVDTSFQQENQLSVNYGVYVTGGQTAAEPAVVPGGPADKAGIQSGDIILDVNGDEINSDTTLQDLLQKYQPGNVVKLTVLRKGSQMTISVTLGTAPSS